MNLLVKIKSAWLSFRVAAAVALEERRERLRQETCPHRYQPAKTLSGKPARVCPHCGRWDELTPAEFFAWFGTYFR